MKEQKKEAQEILSMVTGLFVHSMSQGEKSRRGGWTTCLKCDGKMRTRAFRICPICRRKGVTPSDVGYRK